MLIAKTDTVLAEKETKERINPMNSSLAYTITNQSNEPENGARP